MLIAEYLAAERYFGGGWVEGAGCSCSLTFANVREGFCRFGKLARRFYLFPACTFSALQTLLFRALNAVSTFEYFKCKVFIFHGLFIHLWKGECRDIQLGGTKQSTFEGSGELRWGNARRHGCTFTSLQRAHAVIILHTQPGLLLFCLHHFPPPSWPPHRPCSLVISVSCAWRPVHLL